MYEYTRLPAILQNRVGYENERSQLRATETTARSMAGALLHCTTQTCHQQHGGDAAFYTSTFISYIDLPQAATNTGYRRKKSKLWVRQWSRIRCKHQFARKLPPKIRYFV